MQCVRIRAGMPRPCVSTGKDDLVLSDLCFLSHNSLPVARLSICRYVKQNERSKEALQKPWSSSVDSHTSHQHIHIHFHVEKGLYCHLFWRMVWYSVNTLSTIGGTVTTIWFLIACFVSLCTLLLHEQSGETRLLLPEYFLIQNEPNFTFTVIAIEI
jgi:hypothetical protein